MSKTVAIIANPQPTITPISNQTFCNGQITQATSLNGTPSNVAFDITGGATRGLPNQIGVTSIPSFYCHFSRLLDCNYYSKSEWLHWSGFIVYIDSCKLPAVILNLKFYIQGYYLGSGFMQQVLFNQGESTDPNSILTDYVIVELHATTFPYAMVKTTIATLKTNGTLTCTFPGSVSNT